MMAPVVYQCFSPMMQLFMLLKWCGYGFLGGFAVGIAFTVYIVLRQDKKKL